MFCLPVVALAILLILLGILQYQWSSRVAAVDEQRERDHLQSAASLFASQFNALVREAQAFLRNDAAPAVQAEQPVSNVPKLIGDLYFIEISQGTANASHLGADGLFTAAPLPGWAAGLHCTPSFTEEPPALVIPVFVPAVSPNRPGPHTERCFLAQINRTYLRDTVFPQLIQQSFGATLSKDFEFAVVPHDRRGEALYGSAMRSDLKKRFLTLESSLPDFWRSSPWSPPSLGGRGGRGHPGGDWIQSIIIRNRQTLASQDAAGLFGPGVWDLLVAHRNMTMDAAFHRARHVRMAVGFGIEALLAAAIASLVLGSLRTERLARQKMQFVAGVSHEFRSPVSAIAMLSRNQADGLVAGADKVKQYGELIHQQSRRLNEMVEQTLQYAGIHSGLRRPARDAVDLAGLIREAVEARREQLAGFEIEITVSPDLPRVTGDAKLLATALDNLLSNAQKYAAAARWIRVSAVYCAPDKEARISVEDRGTGIELADQAEIFEPFCRGRSAIEAQIPGSGLGLSLVRSAAEAHHGSVSLESQPGRGSTFTLHLPV
jgi:two-component system, OmpR family, sensor histidine kinase SenX3